MEKNYEQTTFKIKHLIYLAIFLVALLIRSLAAERLTATQPEAEIFLNLTGGLVEGGSRGSVLYQLLTLPLVSMFGNGNLVLRFWVVLAGSLITLLPLFYEDLLGNRTALILAGLLALDPFQSVNSMQVNGSALILLCLFAAVGFLRKEHYGPGLAALLGFLFSGQKSVYGLELLVVAVLIAFVLKRQHELAGKCQNVIEFVKSHLQTIGTTLALMILIMLLLGIQLSDIVKDYLSFFDGWGSGYAVGNLPQLFPIALLAYMPLGFIGLFPFRTNGKKNIYLILAGSLIITLIAVAIQPGHQLLDLVWPSLILCTLCAIKLDGFLSSIKIYPGNIYIYAMLLTAVLISLFINFGMFIYQVHYGINVINKILSIITLFVLLTMAVIFLAYNETIPFSLTALRIGLFITIFIVQIAFTWRTTGLNGNPSSEILWGGYFEDTEIVIDLIDNADFQVLGTGVENKVALLDYTNQAVKWTISQNYELTEHLYGLGVTQYAVVLTDSSDEDIQEIVDGYYGQNFIANSYPLWTWQPLKSLADSDFWYWLVFRQGQMVHDNNYIWIDKTLFQ